MEIGGLFRDLRRVLKLSLPELASRLGTRIEVVTALERGEIHRLPPWPETVRVVTAFTSLAKIDPRPVLGIIRERMERGATTVGPSQRGGRSAGASLARAASVAAGRIAATAQSAASFARGGYGAASLSWFATDAAFERDERPARPWLGRSGIMVVLVLSLTLATYIVRSTGLEDAFAELRTPIARLVNKAQDFILKQVAVGRDGMRWIDVDDPRSRRADRLKNDAR